MLQGMQLIIALINSSADHFQDYSIDSFAFVKFLFVKMLIWIP